MLTVLKWKSGGGQGCVHVVSAHNRPWVWVTVAGCAMLAHIKLQSFPPPRAGIHRAKRNQRIRPDCLHLFLFSSSPTLNMAACQGHTVTIFITNVLSDHSVWLEFLPHVSIFSPSPSPKTTVTRSNWCENCQNRGISVPCSNLPSPHFNSFILDLNYMPKQSSLTRVYNWGHLTLSRLLSGCHICGICTLQLMGSFSSTQIIFCPQLQIHNPTNKWDCLLGSLICNTKWLWDHLSDYQS